MRTEEASSVEVTMQSLFLGKVIDAKENYDTISLEMLNVFMQKEILKV